MGQKQTIITIITIIGLSLLVLSDTIVICLGGFGGWDDAKRGASGSAREAMVLVVGVSGRAMAAFHLLPMSGDRPHPGGVMATFHLLSMLGDRLLSSTQGLGRPVIAARR